MNKDSATENLPLSECDHNGTCPLPSSASFLGTAKVLDCDENAGPTVVSNLQSDHIAIVGLSLRLPGEASSVEPFWDLMMKGHCTATGVPADRYNIEAHHSLDSDAMGTVRPNKGHFLKEDLGVFDSAFFGYSESEATAMDPQQRALLETTYLALENAGLPMENIYGSETSVHIGSFSTDYMLMMAKDPELAPKYSTTGMAASMLSNRVSSFFDLKGISVSLDTACSSSLVAIHQSCQTLQLGHSSLGIAGGCNITASPQTTIGLSNLGFLSPDGVCHSFDHRANGYARAEGFGVVILKRLSDAIRDGDTIRAVIRAAGSNQDGNTPLAQPSKDAQVNLIEKTYRAAGLDPSETSYVEAHGTGTAVGDPLEARAIGQAFCVGRKRQEPLYVGSLKANFGHLEGAAGVAGLIKAVLALERGIIPPLAELEKINPEIDADFLNIKFNTKPTPWPCRGLRRASVNSFGFGGTNAHVVLDDAYHYMYQHGLEGKHCTSITPPSVLDKVGQQNLAENGTIPTSDTPHSVALVWSAPDESSLSRMLSHYVDWLSTSSQGDGKFLFSLAYTLLQRRSLFSWRSFAISDPLECQSRLQTSQPILSRPVSELSLAFVFTGQGAQWSGMGKELFVYDVFRQSVLEASSYLASLGCNWSVAGALTGKLEKLEDPAVAQPICTVLQVALIQLLASVNILPSAVIGHSSGEIAAAYACGAICRESAWKLAYYRGVCSSKLVDCTDIRGAMISVGLSVEEAQQQITRIKEDFGCDGSLAVACVNSPTNVTISGDEEHIKALKTRLAAMSVFARLLRVPVAYHGPHMNRVSDAYLNSIDDIKPEYSTITKHVNMVSSVTGERITKKQLQEPSYWVRNMVSQVKFMPAIQAVFATSQRNMSHKLDLSHLDEIWATDTLEIGPHATLSGVIRESLQPMLHTTDVKYQSVLVRKKHSCHTILNAAAQLYCRGYPVKLSELNKLQVSSKESYACLSTLPAYPFDHAKSFWYESRIHKDWRFRKHAKNAFLGTPVADWNPSDARWRHFWNANDPSWIRDHKIGCTILFPAAGMLVIAIEAATQLAADVMISAYEFRDVTFSSALELSPDSEGIEVQLQMIPRQSSTTKQGSQYDFCITAYKPDWTEVCRGSIRVVSKTTLRNDVDCHDEEGYISKRAMEMFTDISKNCDSSHISGQEVYSWLKKLNYNYGPTFARVQSLRHSRGREAIGEIEVLPIEGLEKPSVIHPATLDAIFHPMIAAMMQDTIDSAGPVGTSVPTRVDRLWISSDGLVESESPNINVAARSRVLGHRMTKSNVVVFSQEHLLKAYIEGMEAIAISDVEDVSSTSSKAVQRLCWNVIYKPDVATLTSSQLQQYLFAERRKNVLWPQFFLGLESMLHGYLTKAYHVVSGEGGATLSDHVQGYLQWMLRKLDRSTSDLVLCSDVEEEQYTSTSPSGEDSEEARKILLVFRQVGENLASILKGQIDPLELLFQDTMMDDFYEMLLETANYQVPLARYLDIYAHKYPSMNILEVGAGTGGTTKRILQTLAQPGTNGRSARYAKYCFTDISSSFFEKAEQNLQEFPRIQYKTLDIESHAMEQGFEAESFDIIVASLVLHATKSLDQSLTNLRRLLKPGGTLILCEITHPDSLRAGFVFGILPGWWLSEEKDRQERLSPCIAEHDWHRVLETNGFSGCDQVFYDQDDKACRTTSIVLSTKTEDVMNGHGVELKCACIVFTAGEDESLVRACQEHIESHGISPRMTTFEQADADVISSTEELLVVCDNSSKSLIEQLERADFEPFCRTLSRASNVLWIAATDKSAPDGPSKGSIVGLARVLRAENQLVHFTLLEVKDLSCLQGPEANLARSIQQCLSPSTAQPFEDEIRENNGMLHIPRVVEDTHLNSVLFEDAMPLLHREVRFGSTNLRLTIQTPGLLDTLTFAETSSPPKELLPTDIQVSVKATGVNFRDCLGALGRIPDDNFGTECAGIVERVGSLCKFQPGDRVMVLSPCAFSSSFRCNEKYAVKIPDDLPFTEAAKIPTNFGTAYMALVEVGRIRKGETILIHAGAGGTGQAAIQIAQCFGAEVFVTVGSQHKKQLVMSLYNIPSDHIFYSRDISFAEGIMHYTQGRGVDLILNSLAGEELRASWECIAPFGRFLEIGKRDIYQHEKMPMFPFAQNVTFSAVDLASMEDRIELLRATLEAVVKLIEQNKIHVASPLKTFSLRQIEDAFRYLQSGNNAGAVAVEVDPDETVHALVKPSRKHVFKPDATYVIAGGFGGQGLSIARWMAKNGAKYFLMLSRQGRNAAGAEDFIEEMSAAGVHIDAPACDITIALSVREAVEATTRANMPPIKGCIQAAMVIRDSLFSTMTYEDWHASTGPKIAGSWNLHTHLPLGLDFFILLSSIGGVIGSSGQSNYSAGNTYLDALAAYRLSLGQKAISLNLSAMSEAGYFIGHEKMLDILVNTKQVIPMMQADLFSMLRYCCDPELRLEDMKSQYVMGLTLPADIKKAGHDMAYMYRAFFSHLHQLDSLDSTPTTASPSSDHSGQLDLNSLRAAKSKSAAAQMLTTALQAKLSKVFSSNAEELDVTKPLVAYGVDSLVAVELRNWFLKTLKVDIPVFEILGGATIEGLGSTIAEKMDFNEAEK